MIKKITFVALLIALATATFWIPKPEPKPKPVPLPPVKQYPSTGCYFSKNNLIVNGGFENPCVESWSTFSTI